MRSTVSRVRIFLAFIEAYYFIPLLLWTLFSMLTGEHGVISIFGNYRAVFRLLGPDYYIATLLIAISLSLFNDQERKKKSIISLIFVSFIIFQLYLFSISEGFGALAFAFIAPIKLLLLILTSVVFSLRLKYWSERLTLIMWMIITTMFLIAICIGIYNDIGLIRYLMANPNEFGNFVHSPF